MNQRYIEELRDKCLSNESLRWRQHTWRLRTQLPLTQTSSPSGFHPQVLRILILGQVVHCFVHLAAPASVTLTDDPYA